MMLFNSDNTRHQILAKQAKPFLSFMGRAILETPKTIKPYQLFSTSWTSIFPHLSFQNSLPFLSSTPFKIFMDKKKKKNPPKDNKSSYNDGDNDISIVKAAAWAWYQHGSGSSDDKPMREFDVTRTYQTPYKPSRYKLEAMMRSNNMIINKDTNSNSIHPTNSINSLLDAYEIQSISKRLDDLIVESSVSDDYRLFYDGDQESIVPISSNGAIMEKTKTKKKKKKKMFLKGLWFGHSIVCGTRKDVDSRAFVRRLPPPVVAAGNCVPVASL